MSVLAECNSNTAFEVSIKKTIRQGADKSPIQSRLESYQPRLVSPDAIFLRVAEAATRRSEVIVKATKKRSSHNNSVLKFIQNQKQDDDKAALLLEEKLMHKQKIAAENAATCISKKVYHLSKLNNNKLLSGLAAMKRRAADAKILEMYIDEKIDAAKEKREKISSEVAQRLSEDSDRKTKCTQSAEKKRQERCAMLDKTIGLKTVEAETRKEQLQCEQVMVLAQQVEDKLQRGKQAHKRCKTKLLDNLESKIVDAQKRREEMRDEHVKKMSKITNAKLSCGAKAIKLAEKKSKKLNEKINEKLESSAERKKISIATRVQSIAKLSAFKARRSKGVIARQHLETMLLELKIDSKLHAASTRKEELLSKYSEKLSDESKRKSDQCYDTLSQFYEEMKKLQHSGQKRITAAAEQKKVLDMEQLTKVSRSTKMKMEKVTTVSMHKRMKIQILGVYSACKVKSATERREGGMRSKGEQISGRLRHVRSRGNTLRESSVAEAEKLSELLEAKLVKAAERKEAILEGIAEQASTKYKRKYFREQNNGVLLTPRSPEVALATLQQRLSDASARRASLLAQRVEDAQLKNRRRKHAQQVAESNDSFVVLANETTDSTDASSVPQCVEPSMTSSDSISDVKGPSPSSDLSESHPKKLFSDTTFGLSLSTILLSSQNQDASASYMNGSNSQRSAMVVTSSNDDVDQISPLASPVDNSWDRGNEWGACSIM